MLGGSATDLHQITRINFCIIVDRDACAHQRISQITCVYGYRTSNTCKHAHWRLSIKEFCMNRNIITCVHSVSDMVLFYMAYHYGSCNWSEKLYSILWKAFYLQAMFYKYDASFKPRMECEQY